MNVTAEDVAQGAADTADDVWANLRTESEELVDEVATGNSEAQEQLLERCRETLEELRKAEDPGAERVGQLCDNIRDADDETAWDDIRQEFGDIDVGR